MATSEKRLKFIELAESTLRTNVCMIEDALQSKFHHLALGKRLWRHVGKGDKYVDEEDEKCVVFFTFSFKLPALIADGTIIVQT